MASGIDSPLLSSWNEELLLENKSNKYKIFVFILCAVLYFLSLRLTIVLSINHMVPLYFASGVGFASMLLWGRRLWISIAVATIASGILSEQNVGHLLAVTLANVGEALVGVSVARYFLNKQKNVFKFYSTALILLPAALAAAATGVLLEALTCSLTDVLLSSAPLFHRSLVWLAARFLGVAALVPFFLSLTVRDVQRSSKFAIIVLMILGAALGYLLLFTRDNAAYLFVLFPYILLCTIVFDRGAKFLTLLLSVIAILLTQAELGPFAFERSGINLVNLQAFLMGISITGVVASDFRRLDTLRTSGLVLLWGSVLSSLVFFITYTLDHKNVHASFLAHVDDALNAVHQQMSSNIIVLRSGVGIIEATGDVSRNEWKEFVEQLRFYEVAKGLQGIGLLQRVEKKDLKRFEARIRREGLPSFQIKRLSDIDYDPVASYILVQAEPLRENSGAIGIDMSTEYKRQSAAMSAVDSGELSISQSIVLRISSHQERSFLLFYPIYKKGSHPQTLEERRENHKGWVVAPVMTQDFFAAAWEAKPFDNLLYTVTEPETGQVLASSLESSLNHGHFDEKRILAIADRAYILHFKASQYFVNNIKTTASWAGITAALLSLLLSVFTAYIQLDKNRAVQRVKEQTHQLEITGQMAKLGGWSYDLESARFYLSRSAKSIYGASGEFFPSLTTALSFFKEGEDRDDISKAMQRCIQKGIPFDLELEFVSSQAQSRWVRIIGEAEFRQDRVVRVFGALQDITERVKLEDERSLIIESLKVGIWKYYPQTQKLIWDRSMYQLYDVNPHDFNGHYDAWESTLDEKSREEAVAEFQRALKSGNEYNTTFQIRDREGKARYIGARGVIFRDSEGKAKEMYGINWDRTKEILLEQQLNQERVKALHSVKLASLGEMSAGVAHEINNPLSIITGSTELLAKFASQPEKLNEKIDVIRRAAHRIERIVSGLNKFSRAAGISVRELADPVEIAKEALVLMEVKAKKNSTTIITELTSKSKVVCDHFEIEQVIVNLLSNGIDAAKGTSENWVKIQCFDEGASVVFRVSDSGPGIPEPIREKIFDPFFTTKKVGEGTGLGLPISKGILEEHGATFTLLTDSPNTCFEIRMARAGDIENA